MGWIRKPVIGVLFVLSGAPVVAQGLEPARGVDALAVFDDGRILVRNGEATFDCGLVIGSETVELGDCRARGTADGDAAALLAALTDDEWQALVRDTLLDAQCRLSAFNAVTEVLAEAAIANGASPEAVDRARAELSVRAEAAVAQMLREGRLSYREGELALDQCP